ncbi:hypothetical protein PRIPAC_88470 [Pristionchus pacificus]|uniref:Lipocalin domain-containing protein n=1 Tax=Pristionchus pacificus TaxID=54126 RepID=A0A2A6CZ36_PRIPA|nr:hypothetical protein PRIPAC_88470 [Pristionchus pacificus]|eukprot:PDM83484.1 hypothetical protein PRIPAC_35116 [Pristionchus pacificus]
MRPSCLSTSRQYSLGILLLLIVIHHSNPESLTIEGSGIIYESKIFSYENYSYPAISKDLCEPLSQYANVSLAEDLEYRKLMGRWFVGLSSIHEYRRNNTCIILGTEGKDSFGRLQYEYFIASNCKKFPVLVLARNLQIFKKKYKVLYVEQIEWYNEEVLNWLNNNDFKIGENNPLVQPEYRSCFYDDSFTSNIGSVCARRVENPQVIIDTNLLLIGPGTRIVYLNCDVSMVLGEKRQTFPDRSCESDSSPHDSWWLLWQRIDRVIQTGKKTLSFSAAADPGWREVTRIPLVLFPMPMPNC